MTRRNQPVIFIDEDQKEYVMKALVALRNDCLSNKYSSENIYLPMVYVSLQMFFEATKTVEDCKEAKKAVKNYVEKAFNNECLTRN
tara:strand:- start:83 stop:340 length:258 start_codon:yes stop_codon:yes gene_type:complete